jgi:MraZ protein
MAGIQADVRFIGIDNKIEIWAKEKTEQPFMSSEAFGMALEEIMNNDKES